MTSSENQQIVVDVPVTKVQEYAKTTTLSDWFAAQSPALLSEGLATMMLLFFGCMTRIPMPGLTEQSFLLAPIGYGLIIMVLVQIFGHISGAHMNPVVTVSSILWGTLSIPTGIAYFVSQTIGAIIGYGLLMLLSPVNLADGAIGLTLPHNDLSILQAIVVEIFAASILIFLCCSTWDPRNNEVQDSVPIKFGLMVAGTIIAAGPFTGASVNPVRSLAPVLWTGIWTAHYVYWVGPFVGGIITVLLYKYCLLLKHHRNEIKFGIL